MKQLVFATQTEQTLLKQGGCEVNNGNITQNSTTNLSQPLLQNNGFGFDDKTRCTAKKLASFS